MTAHATSDGNTVKPVPVLSGAGSTAETATEIEVTEVPDHRDAARPGRRAGPKADRSDAFDPAMTDGYGEGGGTHIANAAAG